MTTPTILVATWSDGVFVIHGDARHHELPGQAVRSLTPDGQGGALAIVDGHSLARRGASGDWSTLATNDHELACALRSGDACYVGTDDVARVLRVAADGQLKALTGFDATPGRENWYAGTAVINGQVVGPPLGIRSMTATADEHVVLASVHVGGVPRSTDGGATWHPTLDIEADIHEVRAHPTRPELIIAAAAVGLCISRDAGAHWTVETRGLQGSYCSAVAFTEDDMLVAASSDHFAAQGAIYRRPLDGECALEPVAAGLPEWLGGIIDTGCLASTSSSLALVDKSGSLYVTDDAGRNWERRAEGLTGASSVLVV